MKKKETKESSYLAIINDLSEDIGISTEETKVWLMWLYLLPTPEI